MSLESFGLRGVVAAHSGKFKIFNFPGDRKCCFLLIFQQECIENADFVYSPRGNVISIWGFLDPVRGLELYRGVYRGMQRGIYRDI